MCVCVYSLQTAPPPTHCMSACGGGSVLSLTVLIPFKLLLGKCNLLINIISSRSWRFSANCMIVWGLLFPPLKDFCVCACVWEVRRRCTVLISLQRWDNFPMLFPLWASSPHIPNLFHDVSLRAPHVWDMWNRTNEVSSQMLLESPQAYTKHDRQGNR